MSSLILHLTDADAAKGRSLPDTEKKRCACGRVLVSQWFLSDPFGVGRCHKFSERHILLNMCFFR